jgi:glucose/mannose-6-phosphate isomerase
MTEHEIKIYDKSNMFDVLANFSKQVEDAVDICKSFILDKQDYKFNKIIICGMGGSAIGGDLLRSYCMYESRTPIFVNRNYRLPAYADENTLIISSSYSGNTEETLSVYAEAVKKNCKIICISSGGKLSILAQNNNNLLISVPKGLQPRCAIGFSFFPLLILMTKLGLISDKDVQIIKVIQALKNRTKQYVNPDESVNNALKIAYHLAGKIPVIYSSIDFFDIVNLRWRGQFEENAKTLAYGNCLPEMNHNEIVGWQENPGLLKKIAVIILKDKEDLVPVKKRIEITIEIIKSISGLILEIEGEGESLLERLFDVIYLGDWVSYYLAIMNKTDPTPVEKITFLKNKLAES